MSFFLFLKILKSNFDPIFFIFEELEFTLLLKNAELITHLGTVEYGSVDK